jgi:hypothetical protein
VKGNLELPLFWRLPEFFPNDLGIWAIQDDSDFFRGDTAFRDALAVEIMDRNNVVYFVPDPTLCPPKEWNRHRPFGSAKSVDRELRHDVVNVDHHATTGPVPLVHAPVQIIRHVMNLHNIRA